MPFTKGAHSPCGQVGLAAGQHWAGPADQGPGGSAYCCTECHRLPGWGLPAGSLIPRSRTPHEHPNPRGCLSSMAFLSSKSWGFLRRGPSTLSTEGLGWAGLRAVPLPHLGLRRTLAFGLGSTTWHILCPGIWTHGPKRPPGSGGAQPAPGEGPPCGQNPLPGAPKPREGLCQSAHPALPHPGFSRGDRVGTGACRQQDTPHSQGRDGSFQVFLRQSFIVGLHAKQPASGPFTCVWSPIMQIRVCRAPRGLPPRSLFYK